MCLSPVTCCTFQFISSVISAFSGLLDPLLGKDLPLHSKKCSGNLSLGFTDFSTRKPTMYLIFSHAYCVSHCGVRNSSSWSSFLHFSTVASVLLCSGFLLWGWEGAGTSFACSGLAIPISKSCPSKEKKLHILPPPWKAEMLVCYRRRKKCIWVTSARIWLPFAAPV